MRTIGRWLLVCALVLPLSAGVAAERKFEKQLPATSGGTLRLTTDVGSVKVMGTDEAAVSVVALMKGKEKDIDAFAISVEPSGDGVEVTGRANGKRGWFWNSTELDVEFTIRVPHSYRIELHTSGGDLAVSSVKGELRAETSGGDISAKGVEGAIKVETSGGDIHIEQVTGDLKAETSGGDIVVGDVKGNADVGTSGGDVKLGKVSGRVRAETSGGDIHVVTSATGNGVEAETSGGDIEITVPKGIGATIDASTTGGDVVTDLPVSVSGRVSEGSLRGTVNGGGVTIRARTSGGEIRIKAAP
jgi:DUF4097 and DUF4098 domain-containing protein YvlB